MDGRSFTLFINYYDAKRLYCTHIWVASIYRDRVASISFQPSYDKKIDKYMDIVTSCLAASWIEWMGKFIRQPLQILWIFICTSHSMSFNEYNLCIVGLAFYFMHPPTDTFVVFPSRNLYGAINNSCLLCSLQTNIDLVCCQHVKTASN